MSQHRHVPRVLLVHQPIDGGVGRHVSDLMTGLAERGYDVIVCGPAPPKQGLADERVHHVTVDLRRSVSPVVDVAALWDLIRVIREVRPDIIHAHSSKAGAVTRLAHVLNHRIPVVYTPHLYSFASYFAHDLERFAYRQVERALAPLADRVVCVCEAEAQLARTVGPSDRVRVVYNGIGSHDQGKADPRMVELSSSGPVICAIALLQPRKGIETLIDATPGVLDGHPRAQIAIWGDGPSLRALRDRASALGVAHAVHFLGLCDDSLAALRGADVFVHPALAEAFPYVVLEAMSVGAPVVASGVGGVGEAVVDGESGILVAPGQASALTKALLEMLADEDQRRRMGAAAQSRCKLHFNLEAMFDGILGVYGEVSPVV